MTAEAGGGPDAQKPLDLKERKNIAENYLSARAYSGVGKLPRDGAIYVQLLPTTIDPATNRTKQERFSISLHGNIFTTPGPMFRAAAEIKHTPAVVLQHVNRARGRWMEAVVNALIRRPSRHGGHEQIDVFQQKAEPDIDDSTFRRVVADLAVAGDALFQVLFERGDDSLLAVAKLMRAAARRQSLILTIFSEQFHIPWGVLYTHPHESEPLAKDGSNWDPLGFWGYRHIIEEFPKGHGVPEFGLVAENNKLPFGAGLDETIDHKLKVSCIKEWRAFTQTAQGQRLRYDEWTKKQNVQDAFTAPSFAPRIVYLLCHADGAGTADAPTMGLAGFSLSDSSAINAADIEEWLKAFDAGNPPLFFLNACQAGHLSTLFYGSETFAGKLLEKGASCVVGPQVEIPAVFAGDFGRKFFEQLVHGDSHSPKVALILRDLVRHYWERRNPLGLVYSLYSGADCQILWQGTPPVSS